MALDAVRVDDTRAWLTKTNNDIRGAEVDLAATPPLLEDVMFHCQQAVEKAFKAFLTWHDVPFRRIHDLEEVGRQCAAIDGSLHPYLPRVATLTHYAWQYRYPSDDPPPSAEGAEGALALARGVVEAIHLRLPPETHP